MKLSVYSYTWHHPDDYDFAGTQYGACVSEDNKTIFNVSSLNDPTKVRDSIVARLGFKIRELEENIAKLDKLKRALDFIENESVDWEDIQDQRDKDYERYEDED